MSINNLHLLIEPFRHDIKKKQNMGPPTIGVDLKSYLNLRIQEVERGLSRRDKAKYLALLWGIHTILPPDNQTIESMIVDFDFALDFDFDFTIRSTLSRENEQKKFEKALKFSLDMQRKKRLVKEVLESFRKWSLMTDEEQQKAISRQEVLLERPNDTRRGAGPSNSGGIKWKRKPHYFAVASNLQPDPKGKRPMDPPPTPVSICVHPSELAIKLDPIEEIYRFGKNLGCGKFGTLFECQEIATGKLSCCKAISKTKLKSPENKNDVRREIAIMHHLVGHENIVDIYGAYEDKDNVYIVMELCEGGDLYDTILDRMDGDEGSPYSERDAAAIAKTIIKVVEKCHAFGVIHRDLKPENFLVTSKGEGGNLKATDFGLSTFFRPGEGFDRHCGTPTYMAPEVVKWAPGTWDPLQKPPKYGPEVDIWSAGVIVYELLCGFPPFYVARAATPQEIFECILKGNPDFSSPPWDEISGEAKDLLKWMLQLDPKLRATSQQVLCHPWINGADVASDLPLSPLVTWRLKQPLPHHMGSSEEDLQLILC